MLMVDISGLFMSYRIATLSSFASLPPLSNRLDSSIAIWLAPAFAHPLSKATEVANLPPASASLTSLNERRPCGNQDLALAGTFITGVWVS